MSVCQYVCRYVGMYVGMSVCMSVCRYVCRYVGMYVGMSVCLKKMCMTKCVGGITWSKHAHAQSKFGTVKTDL